MTPKPEILSLLEKLQNFTPNEVDEERGSFKIGDSVIYNMLGGALSNSDLIRTLGINEHTLRVSHNGAIAKIVEIAGEEVSRYNIVFEDGFIINDVAPSELKAVKEAVDFDWLNIRDRVKVLRGGAKGQIGIVQAIVTEEEAPEQEGGQIDVKLDSGKVIYLGKDDIELVKESKTNEADEEIMSYAVGKLMNDPGLDPRINPGTLAQILSNKFGIDIDSANTIAGQAASKIASVFVESKINEAEDEEYTSSVTAAEDYAVGLLKKTSKSHAEIQAILQRSYGLDAPKSEEIVKKAIRKVGESKTNEAEEVKVDEMRSSATKIAQELFSKQIGELTAEEKDEVKQVLADQKLKSSPPASPGAKVDEAEDGLTAKDVATSELKAPEPSGTQPKPQEEPNLDAEALHLEDYSKDDLEKVKSKSAETGDAIRKVEDDELKIAPDKVGKSKKESKVNETKDVTGVYVEQISLNRWDVVLQDKHGEDDSIKQLNNVDDARKKAEEVASVLGAPYQGVRYLKKESKTNETTPTMTSCPGCGETFPTKDFEKGDGNIECPKCGWRPETQESKLKEEETEFTPSRVEFKKIGDEKLALLLKNARRSYDYWEKDKSEPEKASLAAKAVARYEEEMVSRGLMSSPSSKESKVDESNTLRTDRTYTGDELEDLGYEIDTREGLGEREFVARGEAFSYIVYDAGNDNYKVLRRSEKKESKFSFMKKQKPLWLCGECHKTFRNDESVCTLCESKEVERISEQIAGFAKEVFQVTWKNTDTGKEESTRVMAYDKADAKREAKRSNREDIEVEGPITEEPKKEEAKVPFDESSEGSEPYTITWQNLDEPHGEFRFFDVNAQSSEHAKTKGIDTLKRDGIPEKFIEIKAVELKEREQKVTEDDPITAIEIVTSNVDPDAYNIRVVQLPEGSIVILDSVSDREAAIERGKEFARNLNAKFLGIIDEKKSLVRPERRMYGMNLIKEQAEKLAIEVNGSAEGHRKNDWSVWKEKSSESKLKEQRNYIPGDKVKAHGETFEVVAAGEEWLIVKDSHGYESHLRKTEVEESKLKEQEKDTFTTLAKGIVDKETADKLAAEEKGQVIQDEEDDTKFAVLVKDE